MLFYKSFLLNETLKASFPCSKWPPKSGVHSLKHSEEPLSPHPPTLTMLWMRHRHPEVLRDLGTGLLLVLILLAGLFVGTSQYLWAPRQGPDSNPWYLSFSLLIDSALNSHFLESLGDFINVCAFSVTSSSGQPYTNRASHYKFVRQSRRSSWDAWIGLTDLYIWGCLAEKGVRKSSSLPPCGRSPKPCSCQSEVHASQACTVLFHSNYKLCLPHWRHETGKAGPVAPRLSLANGERMRSDPRDRSRVYESSQLWPTFLLTGEFWCLWAG